MRAKLAGGLFLGLAVLYHANLSHLTHGDPLPNTLAAISLATQGDFALDEFQGTALGAWNDWKPGRTLPYNLRQASDGKIVSLFGPGAPLLASPAFWLADQAGVKWTPLSAGILGKLAAALAVAGSAALLFLALSLRFETRFSFLLAAYYGLGTSVWPISSQALWQHGPAELLAAAGILARVLGHPALAGACFGGAGFCRPTLWVPAAIFLLSFPAEKRARFAAGAAPFALALAWYNARFFGAPWLDGQSLQAPAIALEKTGDASAWTWPLDGLLGLLFSPARGILFHSPLFFLALFVPPRPRWVPRDPEARAALASFAALLLVGASWFDWWGGWSYGYRPIVDAIPFLAFGLAEPLSRIRSSPKLRKLAAAAALASVAVQALGAFTSDFAEWNRSPDIDRHPERVWELWDGQILHHARSPAIRRNYFSGGAR